MTAGANGKQTIQFNDVFYGGPSPELSFFSQLKLSTSSQLYLAEVQEEGSQSWTAVYSQVGGVQENGFTQKSFPLVGMAGKSFRIRFTLDFPQGSYYTGTGNAYGWFIDAVSFNGMSRLSVGESVTLNATSGTTTLTEGEALWSVSPIISGKPFPSGVQIVNVAAESPNGFAAWGAAIENFHSLLAGTVVNHPTGDWDNDGNPNIVEYAYGVPSLNPGLKAGQLPVVVADPADFVLRCKHDTLATDVIVVPVASRDLVTWFSIGDPAGPAGFTDLAVSTNGGMETRDVRIPRSNGDQWFVRLRVTNSSP